MGFMSYSLALYRNKIEEYEHNYPLFKTQIYEAKQYLKFLDDIMDEGYFYLPNQMNEAYNGYHRLVDVIKKNHGEPFPLIKYDVPHKANYQSNSYELMDYLGKLIHVNSVNEPVNSSFLDEIVRYSEWLKQDYCPNSAYVFLLRDTLLPYLSFIQDKSCHSSHCYQMLISRKWLSLITKTEELDDDFRNIVLEALEHGVDSYRDLIVYCKPFFNQMVIQHPTIKIALDELFLPIKEEHIVVVETGVFATFPVMLACYDARVSIKLYTVTPFLYPIYQDYCYTQAYELNRDFETVICQDVLFKFADYHDNRFYVREAISSKIQSQARDELSYFLTKIIKR